MDDNLSKAACALSSQGAERQILGGHIAILVCTEQALRAPFLAVVDLHDIGGGLLIFVAVCHMHVVVDQLNAGEYAVECNITGAAFVFEVKAVAGLVAGFFSADRGAVQVEAGEGVCGKVEAG